MNKRQRARRAIIRRADKRILNSYVGWTRDVYELENGFTVLFSNAYTYVLEYEFFYCYDTLRGAGYRHDIQQWELDSTAATEVYNVLIQHSTLDETGTIAARVPANVPGIY